MPQPKSPPLLGWYLGNTRHSFSGSSSTSKRDQDLEKEKDLEKYLNELNLNKQKEKNKNIDIKQKGVISTSSQVESAYYTVDNNKTNVAVGSDNESLEPTPSEMYGEDNQLNVIKKTFWNKLGNVKFRIWFWEK